MSKSSKNKRLTYPNNSKEGNLRDANKKLRAQVRNLTKKNRILKSQNRTLKMAFNDTISKYKERVEDYSVEELIAMANDSYGEEEFDHDEEENNKEVTNKCPTDGCDSILKVLDFGKFELEICSSCKYRKKRSCERDEGSQAAKGEDSGDGDGTQSPDEGFNSLQS